MKKLLILTCLPIAIGIILSTSQLLAQNVGIGTTSPKARLHVTDSSVVFTTPAGVLVSPNNPPVSGPGGRMMWYADKNAFRVGNSGGTTWDKDSIGDYSFASGFGTKAKGFISTAMGSSTTAIGVNATAIGSSTSASADYSTAMGYLTNATGPYSTAMGTTTTAGGASSTAMGHTATASGFASIAMGYKDTASGDYATAMGQGTKANNGYSTAMGYYTTASGPGSTTMGYVTTASGDYSTAMGIATTASGHACVAMGDFTSASGVSSTAMGYSTEAHGDYAVAMGYNTIAHEDFSNTMGYITKASGEASAAMGWQTTAKSFASTVIGEFNDTTSASSASWIATDPLFIAGNGTAGDAMSNAFTILKNGNTSIGNKPSPANMLHIFKAGSGVTPNANANLVVESNTNNFINILGPSTNENGILFGVTGNSTSGGIIYNSSNSRKGLQFRTGGNTFHMVLDSTGKLGIGLANPTHQLQLSTDDAAKPGTSTWTVASDERLKTNISDFKDGLAVLNKIHPVWFEYNGGAGLPTGVKTAGILAQEIKKIAPYMIGNYNYEDAQGNATDYLSYNPNSLFYILVNSVKELSVANDAKEKEIEDLKNTENAKLKMQNEKLEAEIAQLSGRLQQLEAFVLQQKKQSPAIAKQ